MKLRNYWIWSKYSSKTSLEMLEELKITQIPKETD
jgi:hypothetical protein